MTAALANAKATRCASRSRTESVTVRAVTVSTSASDATANDGAVASRVADVEGGEHVDAIPGAHRWQAVAVGHDYRPVARRYHRRHAVRAESGQAFGQHDLTGAHRDAGGLTDRRGRGVERAVGNHATRPAAPTRRHRA